MMTQAVDQLREQSRHMLECAEHGDWTRVITLERDRKSKLQDICEHVEPGSESQLAQLISEIMEMDARILELGASARAELMERLDYLRRSRGAAKAYSGSGD